MIAREKAATAPQARRVRTEPRSCGSPRAPSDRERGPARMLLYAAFVIPAFVNSAAGNADEVDRALLKAGFDVRRVAPNELTRAVRAAVAEGATRVAAVGGDGTVSAAAAAIAGTEVELVVIPAGTLNHFARDHGIPTDVDAACAIATSGRVERVDVAWVNDRLFLNTSSVGIYANFVRVR